MPIEQIRIHSIMVIGAAIAAWLSGDFHIVLFLMLVGSVIPLWFDINLDKIRGLVIWKIYGLVNFAFFIYCYLNQIAVSFAVFMLVLFCLVYEFYGEARKGAPARLIGVLAFLILLYKAHLNNGLNLFFGLSIYIFSVIYCLLTLNLGKQNNYHPFTIFRHHYGSMFRYLVLTFVIGLVVYWIFPRLPGQSFSSMPSLGSNNISGFSDRMNLNDIGSLKRSRRHVMDVKPMNGRLHSPYLKGRVMDTYDRGSWRTTKSWPQYFFGIDDQFKFGEIDDDLPVLKYRIDQEPLADNNIFFFDYLVEVEGDLEPLKIEGYFNALSMFRGVPAALSYTVIVQGVPRMHNKKNGLEKYLVVPENHDYIYEEANRILAQLEDGSAAAQATRLVNYFQNTFEYSLDINNAGVDDPLEYFLLDSQSGHCELYASATVLMLRARGIPARMVTGFMLPGVHPSGDFYYVTESDAHAWVEYYEDDHWFIADPTPSAEPERISFYENSVAYIQRIWRTNIISFDYTLQREYLAKIIASVKKAAVWLVSNPVTYILPVLALVIFFMVRGRRFLPLWGNKRAVGMYHRVLRRLARAYSVRNPGEGVYDYLKRLGVEPVLHTRLTYFLDVYHRYRFASQPARSDERELLKVGAELSGNLKQTR